MGDFNLSCITWELTTDYCIATDFEGNCAMNLLNTLNLTDIFQRNNIRNKYNKTLDLVISNIKVNVKRSIDILVNEDDYHPSLCFTIDSTKWFSHNLIELIKDKEYYRGRMKKNNNNLIFYLYSTESVTK